MGLITENNEQYYAGCPTFFINTGVATQAYIQQLLILDLVFGSNDPLQMLITL